MPIEKQRGIEQSNLDYSLIETPNFQEACKIAEQNTSGRLWVAGGYLARTFSKTDPSKGDIDFIAEHLNSDLIVPAETWKGRKRELFPGFKFDRSDGLSVDINELGSWKKDRGLPPTPETVLQLAPFTHMAILYDLKDKKLLGDAGIESMIKRQTGINNLVEAQKYVQTVDKYKGMTVEQVLQQKALELNFTAIL